MDASDKFCPACGAKNVSDPTREWQPEERTKEYAPEATREYLPNMTREYAPVDSGAAAAIPDFEEEDNRTVVLDGYNDPSYYGDDFAEQMNRQQSYQQDFYGQPQPQRPKSYQDSFNQTNPPRFTDSGWVDPNQSTRKSYRKTTAGRKAVSIILCLLMLLFSSCALFIGSARIALNENSVRKAYQKGTIADLTVNTDKGEQTLTDVFLDNVVDAKTNVPIPLERTAVETFLRSATVNNFTENLVVDFTQFFVFGKTPSLLNSREITRFLTSISDDINSRINYSMSEDDINYIGQRIDGGDLSFLSIDDNGGYFKQKYNFDPKLLSSVFSVWALAVCAGLALLCVIMIFVINHGNAPAALSFNGTTMIIFGVLNTLIAAGMLILSLIKPVFLISDLLRGLAFATGGISIAILIIGIIFSVIKTVMKNRI